MKLPTTSKKILARSKRSFAISAAVFALTGATAAFGSGNAIQALNNNQTLPTYFLPAAENAIPGQYIVVLKDQLINQQVSELAGQSLSVLSTESAMNFRNQAVMLTASDLMSATNGKMLNQYHAA
jgi:hypothetical protein